MYGYFQERLQNGDGVAAPNDSVVVTIRRLDTMAPVDLFQWNAGAGKFTSAVQSVNTSNGYVSFYTQPGLYRLTTDDLGTYPARDIVVPAPGIPFVYVDAWPADLDGIDDDTKRIQACIDQLSAYLDNPRGETPSRPGGMVFLGARTYEVTSLLVPNDIVLVGVDPSVTILKQQDGTVGPVIRSLAFLGVTDSPVGGKPRIANLSIDGNDVGVKFKTVTNTNTTNSRITIGNTADVGVGDYVEGTVIAANTFVAAKVPDTDKLELTTAPFEMASGSTPQVTIRKGYVIVEATPPDPVPVITREWNSLTYSLVGTGNPNPLLLDGLKQGLRAWIEPAENVTVPADLWVTGISMDGTKVTVTFQRTFTAPSDAELTLRLFQYNCGVFIGEPDYYEHLLGDLLPPPPPEYEYRALLLDNVQVARCSGDGILVRRKRIQFHATGNCQSSANAGHGLFVEGSADSQVDTYARFNDNWRANVHYENAATPRLIGCDVGPTKNPAMYGSMEVVECNQFYMSGGRLRGEAQLSANNGQPSHGVRLSGVAFEWAHAANAPRASPLPTAFVRLAGDMQLVLESPSFSRSTEAPGGFGANRPDYLWRQDSAAGVATLLVEGLQLVTQGTMRPYETDINGLVGDSVVQGGYVDLVSGGWVDLGLGHRLGVTENISEPPEGVVGAEINADPLTPAPELGSTAANVMQKLMVPPGDWEATAVMQVQFSELQATAELTVLRLEVSENSGALTATMPPKGAARMDFPLGTVPQNEAILTLSVAPFRIAVTNQSERYLVAKCVRTGLTATVIGASLRLRRVR